MFQNQIQGAGLLRYELLPGEPVDELTLETLRQNTPEGVLLLGRETNEEGDFLLLPVAGLVPLLSEEDIVVNIFTKDKLFTKIRAIQNSLGDYMIPADELVLRPEWTWLRPETGEPVLLVLPTPMARDLSLSPEPNPGAAWCGISGKILTESPPEFEVFLRKNNVVKPKI